MFDGVRSRVMPRRPEWLGDEWDLEGPTSRFTLDPAIALGVREDGPNEAAEVLRREIGDWIFDEHEGLGKGSARAGGVGRGAEGLAAVFVFIGLHAAGGVISVAAGQAWKRVVERIRRRKAAPPRFYVSRGGAVYLAVAEVAERFGQTGPLELEAAEEPSVIAGEDIHELAYVGGEPWLVLLRSRERLKRYVVVVSPGGEILGALETAMNRVERYLRYGIWEE